MTDAVPTSGPEPDRRPEPRGVGSRAHPRPSGLRDPVAAVRRVGAGAMAVEALVLLLAIQPIRVLGGRLTGPAIVAIVVLAAVCVLISGTLRRGWAWYAGIVPQCALLGAGFAFHPSLGVLGVVFGLVWWYMLHVRRTVLTPPSDPGGAAIE